MSQETVQRTTMKLAPPVSKMDALVRRAAQLGRGQSACIPSTLISSLHSNAPKPLSTRDTMKGVILAGGQGGRVSQETQFKHKIDIGAHLILRHIKKGLSALGG